MRRLRFLAAGAALFVPAAATAQSTVYLDGVIRDFRSTHPDFGVIPLGETGHYAGTVALTLADRPAHVTGGFQVGTQWRERDNNPIAPHMYREYTPGLVLLDDDPTLNKDAFLDSWDPDMGPYGGVNVGPAPTIQTNSPMPVVTFPTDMPPSVGNVIMSGTVTLNSDLHVGKLDTVAGTTIIIDGAVRWLADGDFRLQKDSQIVLNPGATLDLYVNRRLDVEEGSSINMNTWEPERCRIYCDGNQINIQQNSSVNAIIVAPRATMALQQNDHFYGRFTGKGLTLEQTTGYHAATDLGRNVCGTDLADVAGAASGLGSGGVTDATTFDEWFRDVLSVNQSLVYRIGLEDTGGGVFRFTEPEFHPVDGLLYGNEGGAHNDNFTYEVGGDFLYDACVDQYLRVGGGDGLWVFIDGELVIDLGGADYADRQYIDLDRLGLTDGEVYEFRIFYANRNGTGSAFEIETNVDLISTPPPLGITGSMD